MKALLVTLLFAVITVVAFSQEKESKKKLTKEEKKELKMQQEAEQQQMVKSMVEHREFVLEAYQLRNKQGQTANVNSNINFIMIDSTEVTFQFGSAYTVGVNGIGGVTIEGDISKWEVTYREKSGSYYIRLSITSSIGFFDITLNISSLGSADANITTIQGGQLNYTGKIVPFQASSVYKGFAY